MNTGDFEGKMGGTRLGYPIKHGEKVIVPIIREDFQERFMELYDIGVELQGLHDDVKELKGAAEPNEAAIYEARKKFDKGRMAGDIKRAQLWLDIQTHYDIWAKDIGVRDGFVLVECREDEAALNSFRSGLGMSMGIGRPGQASKQMLSEADIPEDAPEEVKVVLKKLLKIMGEFDELGGEMR